MATPHAAGVAALVWSYNPSWTNAQIRTALRNTAEDLGTAGRDSSFGFGLLRAQFAVAQLTGAPLPTGTPLPTATTAPPTATPTRRPRHRPHRDADPERRLRRARRLRSSRRARPRAARSRCRGRAGRPAPSSTSTSPGARSPRAERSTSTATACSCFATTGRRRRHRRQRAEGEDDLSRVPHRHRNVLEHDQGERQVDGARPRRRFGSESGSSRLAGPGDREPGGQRRPGSAAGRRAGRAGPGARRMSTSEMLIATQIPILPRPRAGTRCWLRATIPRPVSRRRSEARRHGRSRPAAAARVVRGAQAQRSDRAEEQEAADDVQSDLDHGPPPALNVS